ncbi:hypothetical protein JTB14_007560 [Gonioctena quinquepunctata]|nr:hypothetical protein JTB14_007560 [Gonioctena quinquepunctata]
MWNTNDMKNASKKSKRTELVIGRHAKSGRSSTAEDIRLFGSLLTFQSSSHHSPKILQKYRKHQPNEKKTPLGRKPVLTAELEQEPSRVFTKYGSETIWFNEKRCAFFGISTGSQQQFIQPIFQCQLSKREGELVGDLRKSQNHHIHAK